MGGVEQAVRIAATIGMIAMRIMPAAGAA
jgi:hypothetical protein